MLIFLKITIGPELIYFARFARTVKSFPLAWLSLHHPCPLSANIRQKPGLSLPVIGADGQFCRCGGGFFHGGRSDTYPHSCTLNSRLVNSSLGYVSVCVCEAKSSMTRSAPAPLWTGRNSGTKTCQRFITLAPSSSLRARAAEMIIGHAGEWSDRSAEFQNEIRLVESKPGWQQSINIESRIFWSMNPRNSFTPPNLKSPNLKNHIGVVIEVSFQFIGIRLVGVQFCLEWNISVSSYSKWR